MWSSLSCLISKYHMKKHISQPILLWEYHFSAFLLLLSFMQYTFFMYLLGPSVSIKYWMFWYSVFLLFPSSLALFKQLLHIISGGSPIPRRWWFTQSGAFFMQKCDKEMWQRVGRRGGRMDVSPRRAVGFVSSYKLPKRVTVTTLLLFSHVTSN